MRISIIIETLLFYLNSKKKKRDFRHNTSNDIQRRADSSQYSDYSVKGCSLSKIQQEFSIGRKKDRVLIA